MLRIVADTKEVVPEFLQRRPLEEQAVPESVKDRIRTLFHEDLSPQQVVERILREVRQRGDAAVMEYARLLDGVTLPNLEIPQAELLDAYSRVDAGLVDALKLAAERITAFHAADMRQSWMDFSEGALGQRVAPLSRVGAYVPGGMAAYPSTVLMTAIPARVAGVKEIVVTVPARNFADSSGVSPATLVAAHIAGVDRLFCVGGAQAVAAMAYGTEAIPRVDLICGPGNIFVQLAKKMVYGLVDIDGLYGPTELVVVADDAADPAIIAADLLAQAEHDPLAAPVLICTSADLAHRVDAEIESFLPSLQRQEIILASLLNGGVLLVEDMQRAVQLVNEYAPEHLSLMTEDAWQMSESISNAGAIFIGRDSAEAMGDYIAGPSHTLPTGGTARFASPLNTHDFLKVTSVISLDREALKRLGPAAIDIARAEGLSNHARSIELRLESGE